MHEQRTDWMHAETANNPNNTDPWIEPKSQVHGVVLLPHGPLPVCDSWLIELTSTVETRPHGQRLCDCLGEVAVPMS